MNKKRAEFIYKFTGSLLARQLLQAPLESKYAGKKFYRLRITLADKSTKSLSVYQNKLENPRIWKTLQKAQRGEFTQRKFIFHCRNVRGYYHLVDWEELPTKGRALSETKGEPK